MFPWTGYLHVAMTPALYIYTAQRLIRPFIHSLVDYHPVRGLAAADDHPRVLRLQLFLSSAIFFSFCRAMLCISATYGCPVAEKIFIP